MRLLPALLLSIAAASNARAADISGQALDSTTQQPVAGAQITLYVPGILGFPSPLASGQTGADGRYRITVQYSGQLAGVARAPGYAARTQDGTPCPSSAGLCFFRSSKLDVAGDSDAVANFALGAEARLAGRIYDRASTQVPLAPTITLEPAGATENFLREVAQVDENGYYHINGLHPGEYRLQASGWYTPEQKFLDYRWPDRHCDNVQVACSSLAGTLVLAQGSVLNDLDLGLRRGSYLRTRLVSDGDGHVIAHAVTASAAQSGGGEMTTGSGLEPYAMLGPLLPGPVVLELSSDQPYDYPIMTYPDHPCGYDTCDTAGAQPFEVPASAGVYTLEDVHVQPIRSIRGRVTAADGRALAGLRVSAGVVSSLPHMPGFYPAATTLTDANGDYYLEGMAYLTVVVRTQQSGQGWIDRAWPDRECGAANVFCERPDAYERVDFATVPHRSGIDLRLSPGAALAGYVVEEDTNRPLPNHTVTVLPLTNPRSGKFVTTGADGSFRIDGLPSDAYYLFTSAEPIDGYYTAGVAYPANAPCAFNSQGWSDCFPTTVPPLTPDAGATLGGLVVAMPRSDALFESGFESSAMPVANR